MKNIKERLMALISATILISTLCSSAYADFYDPAMDYADFASGNYQEKDTDDNSSEEASDTSEENSENDNTQSDEITEEENKDDNEETELTEESETDSDNDNSEKDNDGVVSTPADEITIYSYKSTVTVGDSFTIKHRLKPSNSDDVVTYTSSNQKVAEVDENGSVTALSKGNTIITVKTSSGVKDRFSLTVKDAPTDDDTEENTDDSSDNSAASIKSKDIELKHSSVTLYEGDTYVIMYELTPKNSTDSVSFRSLNKAVASVNGDGVVTAHGEGNTRIVCKTDSGKTVKLNVTVVPVMSQEEQDEYYEEKIEYEYDENGNLLPSMVKFAEESTQIQIGEKVSLDARVYPKGAKYKYTIKSDNPSVAKVNSRGEVTGLKAGSAIITLSTDNGKTDSVYVTVYGDIIKGIDVSKWNGDIDWETVRDTGEVQYAMIRASYGYEDTDPKLDDNVRGCEEVGIPYGFYHYMYAKNTKEAKMEAAYFLNVIEQYSPEYPVVLDIEESFYEQMSKKEVTAIVTTFMEALENAGYYAMIYSYAKFFDDNLIMDKIEKYDIWVACWGDEEKLAENYSYHYGMWQYSETGTLDGIDEYVDLNYCYKNYLETIRKYNLNNLD